MGIALEQSENSSTIRLEGAIDIGSAAELKGHLVEALGAGLGTGKAVRVSLAGVEYLDVTAVQLLWAAERAAKASGVEFAFSGEAPAPVQASLAETGFEKFNATMDAI